MIQSSDNLLNTCGVLPFQSICRILKNGELLGLIQGTEERSLGRKSHSAVHII